MKRGLALGRCLAASLCFASALGAVLTPRDASADDATSPQRDAARHFDHAVALYAEADYQGALVEFKRAYATAPNPTVLYNVGETEYQLQDYAGALSAFTRYLSDAPLTASHRGEVEASLEVLRTRVGHLNVVTAPPGADVAIDDVAVGKTPLADRVVVSVGHRKVTASLAGRAPVVRYVDVAADDNASLTLDLPASAPEVAPPSASVPSHEPPPSAHGSDALRTVGWITTVALAAGATGVGALALKASSDLQNARNTFPVSQATLQGDADQTRTYSILADSLTIGAVVVGGVTLVAALLSPSRARAEAAAKLRVSPASLDLDLTF
jgi:tetratricopeptide (TPR) repeat protein